MVANEDESVLRFTAKTTDSLLRSRPNLLLHGVGTDARFMYRIFLCLLIWRITSLTAYVNQLIVLDVQLVGITHLSPCTASKLTGTVYVSFSEIV